MLIEQVVRLLVFRFLSDYISDLGKDDIHFGLTRGEVDVSNLELRPGAIEKHFGGGGGSSSGSATSATSSYGTAATPPQPSAPPTTNAPVRVVRGKLGRLRLRIPVNTLVHAQKMKKNAPAPPSASSLASSSSTSSSSSATNLGATTPAVSNSGTPTIARIDDVLLVVEPNPEYVAPPSSDGGSSSSADASGKEDILKEIRAWTGIAAVGPIKLPNSGVNPGEQALPQRLVSHIVHNFELFMNDVKLVYRDNTSDPHNPFTIGVTIHKLSVVTNPDGLDFELETPTVTPPQPTTDDPFSQPSSPFDAPGTEATPTSTLEEDNPFFVDPFSAGPPPPTRPPPVPPKPAHLRESSSTSTSATSTPIDTTTALAKEAATRFLGLLSKQKTEIVKKKSQIQQVMEERSETKRKEEEEKVEKEAVHRRNTKKFKKILDSVTKTVDATHLASSVYSKTDAPRLTRKATRSGFMMKQAALLGLWSKKYCVLKDNFLFIFKTDTDAAPSGILQLTDHFITRDKNQDAKPCQFTIHTVTAESAFYVENETELHQWMSVLEDPTPWWSNYLLPPTDPLASRDL
ncbi:hypothetical protein Pelo_12651 [Pelomyxa schiedti]|nr:hypothetical protein Pelo_12651 [Pelomyxa schiedti]